MSAKLLVRSPNPVVEPRHQIIPADVLAAEPHDDFADSSFGNTFFGSMLKSAARESLSQKLI